MKNNIIFDIKKGINYYKVIAKTRQKIIGEFEINFYIISYGTNGKQKRTIPTLSIEVNETFRGKGISTAMVRTLIQSLTKNEAKKVNIMFIDTDASNRGTDGKSFWERIGMRPDRSFGYEKSILLKELKNHLL